MSENSLTLQGYLAFIFSISIFCSSLYNRYYGYIAVHREPFQSCAEMLRQAHEIGFSVGSLSTAVYCGIHYISKVTLKLKSSLSALLSLQFFSIFSLRALSFEQALIAGTKLTVLKEEIAYQGRLIDRQQGKRCA